MESKVKDVYNQIPPMERTAWLSFWESATKEAVGVEPAYTWDQFEAGKASFIEGLTSVVDDTATKDFGNGPLITNYDQDYQVPGVKIPPVLGAFDGVKDIVEESLESGPLIVIAPHPSIATPYLVARSLAHTLGESYQRRMHIIIGPQPTVMDYVIHETDTHIPPVLLGRAVANLILTAPDTDSVRTDNEELRAWLKVQRRSFWNQFNEITEVDPEGENNIIIACPAGRRAANGQEYRVDGNLTYLNDAKTLPVGVADKLFIDGDRPESTVYINPDRAVWPVVDEPMAHEMHARSVMLADSPHMRMTLESRGSQTRRRILGRRAGSMFGVGVHSRHTYLTE